MEKITLGHPLTQSPDFVKENIETLKQLFPTIVKEGKIDLEELQALLGNEVETSDEYYRFTWAGKSMARKEANKPSTGTLRPNKADSKDWDTTQNIFIEGDNLEALKLLQKSYANKIKMIYIDPPYNTGNDFVYKDNYKDNLSNYLAITGQLDEEGRKTNTNTESDGRYHSNWLNMMYPRLKLARNLLKEDGVIFISIDDNEALNLRKICDEIYGEENFIADVSVVNNLKGRNDKRYIATANERLFMYVRTDLYEECGLRLPETRIEEFDLEDAIGKYRELGLRKRGGADTRELRKNMYFPIYVNPTNGDVSLEKSDLFSIEVFPKKSDGKDGCWRWGTDTTKLKIKSLIGRAVSGGVKWDVFEKDYLETDGELRRIKPKSVFSGTSYSTDRATKEYRALMPDADFTSPKSISMLFDLVEYSVPQNSNDIVLDFFAGSGTTAHAVMQLNSDDGGNRKFICVQLPEQTESESETFKAGYKTIAEITKERIRRAGEKVKAELNNDLFTKEGKILDIGFKAFKLDSSNIKAWDGNPDKLEENLFNTESNIKENRTEEDVLYEILLKYGLDLAQPIEQKVLAGKTVFNIGAGALFICLADDVTTEVAEEIGKWKKELEPATCKVIFKDTGFTDVEKTNSMQILKRYGIEEVNSI
jgi:adenine-specific DNA-methyltransferase